MTLNLTSPWLSRFSRPSPHVSVPEISTFRTLTFFVSPTSKSFRTKASENDVARASASKLLDDELLSRVSRARDADEALEMIAERWERSGGVVDTADCCSIISAALDRNNADLALSVFYSMRSSFDQVASGSSALIERWKWSRPDVRVYTSLVRGLAASLRVSEALRMIADVCRVGVSPGEEVPFGKLVRCPSCMIAVAVAQPQHGIQIVSCSKCRYQYELVSGDIASIESEEISMDVPAWKRGLRFLQIMKESIPAAVHSIVVQTPSGMARTHRFATKTVDLPAQEGERVTIALAAPSNVYREIGPFKVSPKAPNFYPGEPMCLTNHKDGRESLLFLSVAAVGSLAVGTTLNTLVFPQMNRLPQRTVDTIAIKQQLLSQYDMLQSRIKDLKGAAEKEVWMLARMCQLENKILAIGEPSYRARKSRVKKVREGLENSLKGRIELIDSYARISSMIEIEVEMASDVLAAEAASNVESIAEQIQQIMELENLEERWRQVAEANDEVERLLSSELIPTEQV
ncbi:uncharacterized protein LOC100246151 isoform X5 [Vitis vinifera]|uniref:uncharacterized protein LOC100246151 isoform X5 n=1 Tax=Vitis vinifera TaxID=29760 RepID=UPI00053F69F1|nr:uncharacterized protein LOC100246151 isoform X5 [Vitis vinifera]|eukprot:XP_010659322.1 PREDICTED: uncharacterized protein LOC100246151 isoform X3 [Vitis vinifera]